MSDIKTVDQAIKNVALRRQFDRLNRQCRELREQITADEAALKECKGEIEPIARKLKIDKVRGDSWTGGFTKRVTKTIKAELLLERGVSMKDIEYATVVTESESWSVRGHKEES